MPVPVAVASPTTPPPTTTPPSTTPSAPAPTGRTATLFVFGTEADASSGAATLRQISRLDVRQIGTSVVVYDAAPAPALHAAISDCASAGGSQEQVASCLRRSGLEVAAAGPLLAGVRSIQVSLPAG